MNNISRNCPDIGVWRAWLDSEQDSSEFEGHLADCPACQRLVSELREEAADVRDVLSALAPSRLPSAADVALARERLDWRPAHPARRQPTPLSAPVSERPVFLRTISTPWRVPASALAAALVITLLVAFTPQASSVAAAFLSQFRSQQVTAIAITPQTQSDIIRTLSALGNLGTVEAPGANTTRPEAAVRAAEGRATAATLDEAAKAVGREYFLTPNPAALPAGADATPRVQIMPAAEGRFTFDKKKAQAYYASTGHPDVSMPDKFDGASLVVSMPTAVILEYGCNKAGGACASGLPALIVGEAGELEVNVEGNVSLSEMRDFLLGLPGLPPAVVSQLKSIQNWNDTLPIPVPVDQVSWSPATINGSQGLMLKDNSGIGSAAIWHANNHLYGVAGSIKATDLQKFAGSLAVH